MDLDPQARWDYIKFLIRDQTITFSKRKVKEDKAQEDKLSERLEELEKEEENEDTLLEMSTVKKDLERIQIVKAQATIFCSRCTWAKYGEKPSKYFLNLEKKNHCNKQISHLQDEDGSTVGDKQSILGTLYNYYSKLYTERNLGGVADT